MHLIGQETTFPPVSTETETPMCSNLNESKTSVSSKEPDRKIFISVRMLDISVESVYSCLNKAVKRSQLLIL